MMLVQIILQDLQP